MKNKALEALINQAKKDPLNKELAFQILHTNTTWLKELSPEIKDDKEFLLSVIDARVKPLNGRNTEGFLLENCSDRLKDDFEFVLACVSINGDTIKYASERLRDNEEIAFAAIKSDTHALRSLSPRLLSDKSFIISFLPYADYHNLTAECLAPELLSDEEFAMKFLSVAGWNLDHFSDEIRDNKEIVTAAVTDSGWAFGYASDRLLADKDVALAAFRSYKSAIRDMDKSLFEDSSFVRFLLDNGAASLFYLFPDFIRDNEAYCRLACTEEYTALMYISERIKDNEDFFRYIISIKSEEVLFYASKRLRDIDDLVIDACMQNPLNLSAASERIRANRALAMYCVERGCSIRKLSASLKDDRELVLIAVTNDSKNFSEASLRLRGDLLIALIALNGTFPHTIYWRADDWDGEYPNNPFKNVSPDLLNDHYFASVIVDAFFKTPYSKDYLIEDYKENPTKIFHTFEEICSSYVLDEGESPEFGLDLTLAIELAKKKRAVK